MKNVLRAVVVTLGVAVGVAAHAQSWPAKPVRMIVPFAAGGGTEIQARLFSRKFFESLGQSFLVDIRTGAGGLIGAEVVAKSPPDGYTFLFTTASISVNVSLYQKIAFDPVKDLQPLSLVSSTPLVLVIHPSVPAKSVKDLVALSKQRKAGLNSGSNATGTTSHLTIEMLKQMTGANVTHIPYKGGGAAVIALMSGETDMLFTTALTAQPHLKSGKIRGLAVTTLKRSPAFPDLPTMDSVYRGFEADNWYAMFLPAGTPKDIAARLHAEIVKALKSPDIRDFIVKEGGEPIGSTPEALSAYFKREVDKYAKVIKAGRITAE